MTLNIPVTREEKYEAILAKAHKISIGDLYELVHGFSRDELLDKLKDIMDGTSDDDLDVLLSEANAYPNEKDVDDG